MLYVMWLVLCILGSMLLAACSNTVSGVFIGYICAGINAAMLIDLKIKKEIDELSKHR